MPRSTSSIDTPELGTPGRSDDLKSSRRLVLYSKPKRMCWHPIKQDIIVPKCMTSSWSLFLIEYEHTNPGRERKPFSKRHKSESPDVHGEESVVDRMDNEPVDERIGPVNALITP